MIIAYFLTRNLYPFLLPSIMSLLDHNPGVRRIYVFAEDDQLPYRLPQQCRVVNVSGQTYFTPDSPNWKSMFSWMIMLRACVSKLLPGAHKVITLDVDTIICDDLTPIWTADMGDNLAMMANENCSSYRPYGSLYYNSGVMVQNLELIRKEGIDDRMIEMLNTERLPYSDQDAWNIVCKGRIMDLPQRYNECPATELSQTPAIVHYAGTRQHWKRGVIRGEYYSKYRKYENGGDEECD